MKKDQSGFSVVEVLVILVIVSLVGAVGWLVYNRQKTTQQAQKNPETVIKNVEPTKVPVDETENWASFTPNSKLYTVKLPDGWTFLHQNDECDCLYSQTMNFKAGAPATVGKTQGGRDGINGFFIVADDRDMSSERFQNIEKQGTITAGDLEGTKYYYEQTTEPEGIGIDKGGKEYKYYFIKNGKGIYISYSINPGDSNNIEIIEKSIKTLR